MVEGKSGFVFISITVFFPSSSLWWKHNIHEWHNLLSWTPCWVSTLPGLHVDSQSTSRIRHLHKFLCYKYRANLWFHHSVVSFINVSLFKNFVFFCGVNFQSSVDGLFRSFLIFIKNKLDLSILQKCIWFIID